MLRSSVHIILVAKSEHRLSTSTKEGDLLLCLTQSRRILIPTFFQSEEVARLELTMDHPWEPMSVKQTSRPRRRHLHRREKDDPYQHHNPLCHSYLLSAVYAQATTRSPCLSDVHLHRSGRHTSQTSTRIELGVDEVLQCPIPSSTTPTPVHVEQEISFRSYLTLITCSAER